MCGEVWGVWEVWGSMKDVVRYAKLVDATMSAMHGLLSFPSFPLCGPVSV